MAASVAEAAAKWSIMKTIGIVMGSDSDWPLVKKAYDTLSGFGVEAEMYAVRDGYVTVAVPPTGGMILKNLPVFS